MNPKPTDTAATPDAPPPPWVEAIDVMAYVYRPGITPAQRLASGTRAIEAVPFERRLAVLAILADLLGRLDVLAAAAADGDHVAEEQLLAIWAGLGRVTAERVGGAS